jgi:hypothetical protein
MSVGSHGMICNGGGQTEDACSLSAPRVFAARGRMLAETIKYAAVKGLATQLPD